MQTPKSRPSSLEVPQKTSQTTPRAARKLKTAGPGSSSDATSSSKLPKDQSPKVMDRRSPRSPVVERKRVNKPLELETQLTQLQEELKKAKEQLSLSESWKKKAQQEAEDAKKVFAEMSKKLEATQKQIQEKDLKDSDALCSAMDEIQKLKLQLDIVAVSEATQAKHAVSAHGEIEKLKLELTETLVLVEKLKSQVNESKEFEAEALEEASNAQMQLELAKLNEETIRGEGIKLEEAYNSMIIELEKSKNQEKLLEELVGKLEANGSSNEEDEELSRVKLEVSQLRSALESAERRYEEEYSQGTNQIRSAYELVERTKAESYERESMLEEKLEVARSEFEKLKETLMDREIKLLSISEENEGLNQIESTEKLELELKLKHELEISNSVLSDLKATLLEKETELQNITEENETLKSEINEKSKMNNETVESAKAAEHEADKSSKKAARIHEQLDALQAANSEMEAELRRLKVQSDQWRKAAEAAANMLSTGNNGKYVERTGSLDYHTLGGKIGPPYSEDLVDESVKKKNGNMLKKISFLLRKGQK